MTVVSTNVEIVHALPAEDLFQIITNFHELAPQAAPEIYKSISVEGEIGVGTLQTNVYGDGVPFTSSKQKFDTVDLPNFSVSFTIFEGDILSDYLDSITHHLKISPSGDGGSVYKHTIDFKCKGDVKPTEEFLNQSNEGIKKVFKAIGGLLQHRGVRAAYWPSFTGYPAAYIETSYFSHIYYAFVLPSATTYALDITVNDVQNLTDFANAAGRWNPPAKTVLAIGGGGGGDLPGIFSQMASEQNSRTTFINSTIEVARHYKFDGVDLDWEYPSNQADMANLGLLFNEWRAALEDEANQTNKSRLILTSAVYYASNVSFNGGPRTYPIEEICRHVDWISPMCYDYHGTWENFTGLHSALYDPNTDVSTEFGIDSWIRAGVPPEKIVLGLPLYGRTWSLQDPNVNTVGAPTAGVGPGNGTLMYSEVIEFNRENNATVVPDEAGYYSYAGDSWISYDDTESIISKVNYARGRALGGYFFWALGQDLGWAISRTASETWLNFMLHRE